MSERVDREIAEMEERILTAGSIEGAAMLHKRLDILRAQRGEAKDETYRRGYQAGWEAGRRSRQEKCDHKGIGLPWCPTCAPRTIAALAERGIEFPETPALPTPMKRLSGKEL